MVEAALIPRLIGFGRARELLLLGEIIDAETAMRWGLVERVVAPNSSMREVEKFCARCSPPAAGGAPAKALMREWENLPTEQAIAAGIDAFVRALKPTSRSG